MTHTDFSWASSVRAKYTKEINFYSFIVQVVQDSSFVQMEIDGLANDAFIRNNILKILYKDINHILKIGDET